MLGRAIAVHELIDRDPRRGVESDRRRHVGDAALLEELQGSKLGLQTIARVLPHRVVLFRGEPGRAAVIEAVETVDLTVPAPRDPFDARDGTAQQPAADGSDASRVSARRKCVDQCHPNEEER